MARRDRETAWVRMDPEWLAAIGEKVNLFPLAWPLDAWLTNLVRDPDHPPLLARARPGPDRPFAGETALVVGSMALAVCVPVPGSPSTRCAWRSRSSCKRVACSGCWMRWQPSISSGRSPEGPRTTSVTPRRATIVACVLVAISVARGAYNCFVEFPDRRIVAVDMGHTGLARGDGRGRRTRRARSGWLADPVHAALYGSSVRVAGHRDVLLDAMKDSALAMYDRGIAMRVADRQRALREHPWDTPDGARALSQPVRSRLSRHEPIA